MSGKTIESLKHRPVQHVTARLGDQIRDGDLQPGERLPSIRQLSKDMGVSPNTITAALGILESQRLVKRDQRRGVFVHQPSQNRRKKAVGLLTHKAEYFSTSDDWSSHVTLSMFEYLNKKQVQPMVLNCLHQGTQWELVKALILENREQLGGVIFCWANVEDQPLHDFIQACDIPIVQIGMPNRQSRYNFVAVDYFGAGRKAATHVLDRLPGPFMTLSEKCPHDFPRRQLIAGFQDWLLQERPASMEFVSLDRNDGKLPPLPLGREFMTQYLEQHGTPPRCVFGIGDLTAIGAMQVCLEKGFKVPEDVCFIGSTGLNASQVCSPTLAHLCQPMDELGHAAVDLMLDMYDEENWWLPGRVLPVQWGDGQSV